MPTSNIQVTPGSGKYAATYSFSEDAVTKDISRAVLNNSAGTEIGTSSNPVQVSLANTAANSTAVKVDGSAVTQPVSISGNQAVNLTQVAGASISQGHGTAATAIRVELPTDGTGLVNAAQNGTWTVQPGNTANTTPWLITQTPATSGGLSIYTGSIGATATSVKGSAGQVYGWYIYNSNASAVYVQFFNTASGSVTLGTTAPVYSLGIPASGGANVLFDSGIAHGTAITVAVTTTRAGSTGPGSTVDLNIFYK